MCVKPHKSYHKVNEVRAGVPESFVPERYGHDYEGAE